MKSGREEKREKPKNKEATAHKNELLPIIFPQRSKRLYGKPCRMHRLITSLSLTYRVIFN